MTMARILPFQKENSIPSSERVGESLLREGCITSDQLHIALHEQERCGKMLGAILVELGFLDDKNLARVLADRTGFPSIDLKNTLLDADLLREFPQDVALRCRAIPVRLEGDVLEIALADPYDVVAMDEIRRHLPEGLTLAPLVASEAAIAEAINHYGDQGDVFDDILREMEAGERRGKKTDDDWTHPIVRLVDLILADGVRRGASDIHLEPENNYVRLRYRIDGVMQQIRILHRAHWPELSHRLKIMAGMNIADTRSLQDGRFDRVIGGATIDFRAAVMPTVQGENIVVRILDHRRALLSLEKLGFNATALAEVDQLLQRPEGIILVTGPTGSGKTTSLYAMLTKIRSADVNIMTLEEPVEYQFEMIRQTSVQEDRGLSFAEGVRGILRQAPDIIFIGEVRDPDTAQMALRASMTGHQVFSTLHCNDALGALPRLIDLGLTPRMLAGNITGILAQRLVRKLCAHCRTLRPANKEEMQILRRDKTTEAPNPRQGFAETQSVYRAPETRSKPMIGEAVGCSYCHGTGKRGRMVIAEILRVTPELDELIASDAPRSVLRQQMRADGFQSMAEDGIAKVLAGEIALSDLRRAVDITRDN